VHVAGAAAHMEAQPFKIDVVRPEADHLIVS
jgi:hypothetical protein